MLAARRRRWTVLVALALVLAVATVLAVAVRDGSGRAVTSLVPTDSHRLAIGRPGRADTVLERDTPEDGWRITAPCALDVEPRRLAPLFDALAGGGTRYPREQVDAAGAGLQPPLATLRFDTTVLSIGGADLSGGRRYVATDEQVELVPEWIWPLLDGGPSALAVPDVFTRTLATVDIAGVSDGVSDGTGGGTGGGTGDGAGDGVNGDAAYWNSLQASQIIVWPPAGPVPASTRLRATLGFEDGARATRELVLTARFEALVHEDGGCAHLLAPGTLRTAPPSSDHRDTD